MNNQANTPIVIVKYLRIKITGQNIIDMGWHLPKEYLKEDSFTLWISSLNLQIKIRHNSGWFPGFLSSWEFDYKKTIEDLNRLNLLPNSIAQINSDFYSNDKITQNQ